jgi:hypothetical protein
MRKNCKVVAPYEAVGQTRDGREEIDVKRKIRRNKDGDGGGKS